MAAAADVIEALSATVADVTATQALTDPRAPLAQHRAYLRS